MPKKEHRLVDELEELKAKTKVIKISNKIPPEEGQLDYSILKEYVEEHNKEHESFKGSLNDYLQKKFEHDERYKGKVIVAEISGALEGGESIGGTPDYLVVDINRADLTGSRLVDITIKSSMKGGALRDCFLQNVVFDGVNLNGLDLRGTKLKECKFMGYARGTPNLRKMQFSFSRPETLQEVGLLDMEERSFPRDLALESKLKKLGSDIDREKDEAIDKYLADSRKQGWLSWGATFTKYTKEQSDAIAKIKTEHEEKFNQGKAQIEKELKEEYTIKGEDLELRLDPTYRPGQSAKLANLERVVYKASAKDVAEFSTHGDKSISFTQYIQERYPEEAKVADGQKLVVDLSGETIQGLDLSGRDLSGVNMAYSTFKGCNFSGAELAGSCFEGANFEQVEFDKADLSDCNFIGAKSDAGMIFEEAIMPRVQMQHSHFPQVNMKGACLYAADFTGSNLSGTAEKRSSIEGADCRGSDFERANIRYIDARYADMTKANLREMIATNADFTEAKLKDARAERANLTAAIFEKIHAEGIDLTNATLDELQAHLAHLEGAVMDGVHAHLANLDGAWLDGAQAHAATFTETSMKGLHGQRLDISRAMMKEVDLQGAKLNEAIMAEAHLYKCDISNAILDDINAQKTEIIACIAKKTSLMRADLQGTNLSKTDFEGANLSGAKFNSNTILFDANFRDAIGAEKFEELQKEQEKIRAGLLGVSRYEFCPNNPDGSNDRFKCQRIGAAILASATGGGAGYTLMGPFGGISAALGVGLLGDYALNYFRGDSGYINNQLGDRLAELGAVALATGAYAIDGSIDGAAAGIICSSMGLVQGLALTAGAGILTAGGVGALVSGYKEKSPIKSFGKKALGATLTAVGAVSGAIGLTTLFPAINTVIYASMFGGAVGGFYGAEFAATNLYNYNQAKKTGMTPEDIYRHSTAKITDVLRKIMPTKAKIISGIIYGVSLGAVAGLVVYFAPVGLGIGLLKGATILTAASGAALSGFVGGYLYDEKVAFWRKTTLKKDQEATDKTPKIAVVIKPADKVLAEEGVVPEVFTAKAPTTQLSTKTKGKFTKNHPPKKIITLKPNPKTKGIQKSNLKQKKKKRPKRQKRRFAEQVQSQFADKEVGK